MMFDKLRIEYYVRNFDVHGFPVIVDGLLLGYATRDALQTAIGIEYVSLCHAFEFTLPFPQARSYQTQQPMG